MSCKFNLSLKEMTIVKVLTVALGSVRLQPHNILRCYSVNSKEGQLSLLRKNHERQIIDTCAESENTLLAAEKIIHKDQRDSRAFQIIPNIWTLM